MSLDSSLKRHNALQRHRNVLTRAERIAKLEDDENWSDEESVFGLVKVAHRKAAARGKPAKDEAAEGVEGAEAPAEGAGEASEE